MSINRVQFQQGLSMVGFIPRYGTPKRSAIATCAGARGRTASAVRPAAIAGDRASAAAGRFTISVVSAGTRSRCSAARSSRPPSCRCVPGWVWRPRSIRHRPGVDQPRHDKAVTLLHEHLGTTCLLPLQRRISTLPMSARSDGADVGTDHTKGIDALADLSKAGSYSVSIP